MTEDDIRARLLHLADSRLADNGEALKALRRDFSERGKPLGVASRELHHGMHLLAPTMPVPAGLIASFDVWHSAAVDQQLIGLIDRWATLYVELGSPQRLATIVQSRQESTIPATESKAIADTHPADSKPAHDNGKAPMRVKRTLRDVLDPAIEQAQSRCVDPNDTAQVWVQLQYMAEDEVPPLLASTKDGVKYKKNGEAAYFKREALDKRLHREKRKPRR